MRQEGIEHCEDEALKIAARNSKGSVRNSLQNLQKIINYVGNDPITAKAANESLGEVEEKLYFDLIHSVYKCNMAQCYKIIENILKDGREIGFIINDIYAHLNNLLKVKVCKKDLDQFGFREDEIKKYEYQSSLIKGDLIISMMNLLGKVNKDIEYNSDPQILLDKFAIESISVQTRERNS